MNLSSDNKGAHPISLGTIVMAAIMLTQKTDSSITLALLFVIGGLSFPLYAVAGAYTNDWVLPEQMSAAASQLVILYGFGAMLGPLAAAPFLDLLDTDGYAWSIITFHVLILAFLIYRIRAWHAPLTNKPWGDVSFHGRAFFVPATIASLGVGRHTPKLPSDIPSDTSSTTPQ